MNLFKINKLKKHLTRTYKNAVRLINDIEDLCLAMPCKSCVFRNGKEKDCFISNMKTFAINVKNVCDNIDKNT